MIDTGYLAFVFFFLGLPGPDLELLREAQLVDDQELARHGHLPKSPKIQCTD